MQIFYAPDITGDTYTLNDQESKHVVRVLRMRKGDRIKLIDGKGNLYEGTIVAPDKRNCLIAVTCVTHNFELKNYRLHIAISILKNQERFEWFTEKSVEIGVDEITPIICTNSERKTIKEERVNNIIISAMKQSLKSEKTVLNSPCSFNDFINSSHSGCLMIAHCNNKQPRNKISDIYKPGDEALILIGPEGDFSNEEIKTAIEKGFMPVNLGQSRLRSETAGIAACHSVYFINR